MWARRGPATEHDIDVVIREEDVETALIAFGAAGLKTARAPEGWLVTAWDQDVLIDLIYRPVGLHIDQVFLDQCQWRDGHAVPMRVLSVEDVLVTKLLALTEPPLDYGPVLEYARSLREQVDWCALRDRTSRSPFAPAFLCLVHELRIAPAPVRQAEP